MQKKITIHMIGNAHIDPVWLWNWERGADEIIATCRTVCDLMEEYPEFTFTKGEAWGYEKIKMVDRDLFERIKHYVNLGRWEVTGGWWVQIDTNISIEESIRQTIVLGKEWFKEHMGITDLPVAYLVDSFGHTSYLPRILTECGQKYFVMMRPSMEEKQLPSALFRWRSPDGFEILTYRIIAMYMARGPDLTSKIEHILANAHPEIDHMMCFYGVGDHGGGPTRKVIEWIIEHKNFAPNVELKFSSTKRFFEAVEKYIGKLPIVEDELHCHALGSYSVCGYFKRNIRRAEIETLNCERLINKYANIEKRETFMHQVKEKWKVISFNHDHDIVTGCSIREAMDFANMEIGGVIADSSKLIYELLRNDASIAQKCKIEGHRLHVVNPLNQEWKGIAECEVWMDWMQWDHHLEDEEGNKIECQLIPPSKLSFDDKGNAVLSPPRILFPITLEPLEARSFKIVEGKLENKNCCTFVNNVLSNEKIEVHFSSCGILDIYHAARGKGWSLLAVPLSFEFYKDYTDTWAHGVEAIGGYSLGAIAFDKIEMVYEGPLRTMICCFGKLKENNARLFVWLDKDCEMVNTRLDISYVEPTSLLKCIVTPHYGIQKRKDRIGGGWIQRSTDGKEYPLHHAICFENWKLGKMALILPDSFAIDVNGMSLRPTLIRNNVNAYDGLPADRTAYQAMRLRFGTDEGPNSVRCSFIIGEKAIPQEVEKILNCIMSPPYIWDDFKGKAIRTAFY